ncbi:hypothetical protein BCF55_0740 [Hydrogenivirga caldilitoris]|uniref:Uncharacterized protein n=1 Tax=Hydrogenivirga caldilitoris TaxID=246264 RepID=A0A497XNF5_9AQUI|nr:hypothetical protein BCF55_0740 [Hydrogenivirga caldilitoris]
MKVRKSLTLSWEADRTLKEKEIAGEEKKAQS